MIGPFRPHGLTFARKTGLRSFTSVPKRIKTHTLYSLLTGTEGVLSISTMERHHQHTSPFPPEFRTTHNFFTKRGVRLASPPYHFSVMRAKAIAIWASLSLINAIPCTTLKTPDSCQDYAAIIGHQYRVLGLRDDPIRHLYEHWVVHHHAHPEHLGQERLGVGVQAVAPPRREWQRAEP